MDQKIFDYIASNFGEDRANNLLPDQFQTEAYNYQMSRTLKKVFVALERANISFIYLKGFALGKYLYDEDYKQKRLSADIDLYICNPEEIERAKNVLADLATNTLVYTTFNNRRYGKQPKYTIEGIGPFDVEVSSIGLIDYDYLYDTSNLTNNTVTEIFEGHEVQVLSLESAFIYYLYHLQNHIDTVHLFEQALYLRDWRTHERLDWPTIAYEYYTFITKYKDTLDWDFIINELNNQSLNVNLKYALDELFKINAGESQRFIDFINGYNYSQSAHEDEYDILMSYEGTLPEKCVQYIENNFEGKTISGSYYSADIENNGGTWGMSRDEDGLHFVFDVNIKDEEIYDLRAPNARIALNSRGSARASCLGLYMAEAHDNFYQYSKANWFIYFDENGEIKVVAKDLMTESDLSDNISYHFTKTNTGYLLTVDMAGAQDKDLYFNFISSYCDNTEPDPDMRRKWFDEENHGLIWYNPTHFTLLKNE